MWIRRKTNKTMEKINFGYSLKNIPIPKRELYMKALIDKTHKFLKRIRWRAYFFDNPAPSSQRRETFGFNSEKSPPFVKDTLPFETEMYQLIRNIDFKQHYNNKLQTKINTDMRKIRESDSLFVSADKTTNLYKLPPVQYNKLLSSNITSTYTKQSSNAKSAIDTEARTIAEKLEIADRVEAFAKRDAYITLKDHKENFINNPKCRLINPAKSEIGIVSKKLLATIIAKVQSVTGVNQWRNTGTVIDWFQNIRSKSRCKFLQMDVVEFYPSISQQLLTDAINFAKSHSDIDDDTLNIIMHARKSLLFCKDEVWVKKNNPEFDVTMGAYDGAEVCELVGLFLLSTIKKECAGLELGLYRDDGLGVTRNLTASQSERLRKKLFAIFKACGLKITLEHNLQQVDFLDVTFNLQSEKYWPFRKPNNEPLYIHVESNHPPSIIKQLPSMIEDRISSIACDESEFNKAKEYYDTALRNSGFKQTIQYNRQQKRSSPRKRNVIWFNPPYNASVLTNIGKVFLSLIIKHFPPSHRYHKIFNRHTVKLSYSCSPNVQSAISAHNRKILRMHNTRTNDPPTEKPLCNCRKADECPLSGNCLKSAIIYQATVASESATKLYIGQTEQTFKKRYPKHKEALANEHSKESTSLSSYVWDVRNKGENPTIKWEVIKQCLPYSCGTRRCDTCLSEKLCILKSDRAVCINKNTELMQKCRHSNKFKLKNTGRRGGNENG